MPSSDGLPFTAHSHSSQDSAAPAVATMVLTKASAVVPLASRLEPALKPNQPTQSSEAPIIVMVSECGAIRSLPYPVRFPMISAPTRPAIPALMCTTVPPAKSRAPAPASQPTAPVTSSSLACAAVLAAASVAAAKALAAVATSSGAATNQTQCAIG